jgi:hypothetical protein
MHSPSRVYYDFYGREADNQAVCLPISFPARLSVCLIPFLAVSVCLHHCWVNLTEIWQQNLFLKVQTRSEKM